MSQTTRMTERSYPSDRWARVMILLGRAAALTPVMKTAPRPADRDLATQDYVAAVDDLVAELSQMKEFGILNDFDDYLRVVYGRS